MINNLYNLSGKPNLKIRFQEPSRSFPGVFKEFSISILQNFRQNFKVTRLYHQMAKKLNFVSKLQHFRYKSCRQKSKKIFNSKCFSIFLGLPGTFFMSAIYFQEVIREFPGVIDGHPVV